MRLLVYHADSMDRQAAKQIHVYQKMDTDKQTERQTDKQTLVIGWKTSMTAADLTVVKQALSSHVLTGPWLLIG